MYNLDFIIKKELKNLIQDPIGERLFDFLT